MTDYNIQNYDDFCGALLDAGFSMGGGNNEGVFGLINYGWENQPEGAKVVWHTGDPEYDPWEWRIRVLDEREDIAYSKLFFNKSGYIAKDWYPCFLAARRGGTSLHEEYETGTVSNYAKKIYELISENLVLPLHAIKQLGGFGKEDKSKFDRALTELQMKLYITMCGRQQKISEAGTAYSWSSTVFCTTEQFWGKTVFQEAAKLSKEQAIEMITGQIYKLNPDAAGKKIAKFICG